MSMKYSMAAAKEPEDYVSAAVPYMGSDDPSSHVDVASALRAMFHHETGRIIDLHVPPEHADFKSITDLPIARIKRIMKSDEDVRMISAEAPVLFAKAAELFVLDMTIRAWSYATEDRATRKRTLTKEAVLEAIQKTDVYDFLVGILLPGAKPQYIIDAENAAAAAEADPSGGKGETSAYAGLLAGLSSMPPPPGVHPSGGPS